MAVTIGTANIEPNLSNGNIGVKVAQLAKEQQEVEGDIALQLIQAAEPATSTPVGNSGHNINIKV
ncbi:cytoplasmic protein [Shewanella eurypsychrophilus]|uniref:Cytoplasmic protein n=1 Tax=Shewanella eurypsychrophilus TaxID=2593656 RepID=A0ABX6V887_9GAMM|nr:MULTISPECIES: cytoplasmic protein [Shewanella]QFU21415.1 cytoplasmic protein [Shewanella sp. YLB-09]QPG56705.1 cytoplasmic protein [Shewanella eurypsychrophilus]